MDKLLEVLQLVQDFTDRLTVKRIFLALGAGVLITLLTFAFENRNALFHSAYSKVNQFDHPSQWEIGEQSKAQLRDLVKNEGLVSMVLVTEIDLQKNRRTPKFWYTTSKFEPQIRKKVETLLPQPVFDYDAANTKQMVGVLNNEFVCARFEDTVFNRHFPYLAKETPVICRIAIPPFYGRFVGMLTVGLNRNPSKDEVDSLRLEAARLSVELYIRDINGTAAGRR